jgi:hypothetical protein
MLSGMVPCRPFVLAPWWVGSNGYIVLVDGMVDGIQVEKVTTASQSKPGNVWI